MAVASGSDGPCERAALVRILEERVPQNLGRDAFSQRSKQIGVARIDASASGLAQQETRTPCLGRFWIARIAGVRGSGVRRKLLLLLLWRRRRRRRRKGAWLFGATSIATSIDFRATSIGACRRSMCATSIVFRAGSIFSCATSIKFHAVSIIFRATSIVFCQSMLRIFRNLPICLTNTVMTLHSVPSRL